MKKICTLKQLLAYENKPVTARYCQEYPETTVNHSEQIFQDLLCWLWLNACRKHKNLKTHMIGPLLELDNMWHVFILHTRSYIDFCQQYFGEYFHHDVEPMGVEHELSPEELEEYLSDCYDQLGEEWVLRNFGRLLM